MNSKHPPDTCECALWCLPMRDEEHRHRIFDITEEKVRALLARWRATAAGRCANYTDCTPLLTVTVPAVLPGGVS